TGRRATGRRARAWPCGPGLAGGVLRVGVALARRRSARRSRPPCPLTSSPVRRHGGRRGRRFRFVERPCACGPIKRPNVVGSGSVTQVLPIVALAIAVIAVVGALILIRLDRRRHFGTPADQATFRTLHTAALASPPLRTGLNADSAERAVKHLRTLLGTAAVALTDSTTLLAWDGDGLHHHEGQATVIAASVLEHGRTDALG